MYFIQCLDALFNCFREVGPGGFDSRLTPSHGENVRSRTGLFTTGQQCGGFCAAAGIRFANQSAEERAHVLDHPEKPVELRLLHSCESPQRFSGWVDPGNAVWLVINNRFSSRPKRQFRCCNGETRDMQQNRNFET